MCPTRRELLQTGALAAVGAAGLAGCGSYVATGFSGGRVAPAEVAYWNLFTGGDGVRMDHMIADVEQRHTAIETTSTTLTWGDPYYTKLTLATLGSRPPDVAVSHLTRMPALARSGLLQELNGDELAKYGLTPDRFTQRAWRKAHVDGKLYAIPLDIHPFVLYYNTKICKKAGLLDRQGRLKPIGGRGDFVRALRKAKQAAQWGGIGPTIDDPASGWRFFYTLYSQAGGSILADEGRRVVLDEKKAIQVLDFMRRLAVHEDVMPRSIDGAGAIAAFAEGRAGFLLHGEWEVATFQTATTPFSMAPFPQLFPNRYVTEADSHSFVLPASSAPATNKRDVCLMFVRGLLDQSLTWAKGGHIPAWLPVRNSAAYEHLQPQSNYADVAEHVVYDEPGWYSGSGANLEDLVGSVVAATMAARLSPRAAVAQMRREIERLARTPSPVPSLHDVEVS